MSRSDKTYVGSEPDGSIRPVKDKLVSLPDSIQCTSTKLKEIKHTDGKTDGDNLILKPKFH
jgi:hypothetical protein